MFEMSNTAFLPELLFDITRAKNCRKTSFRKKMHHIDPVCLEQNTIREFLKKILPREMKSINDNHYGVDYEYRGLTLDQKFSFGALGENTIKIRIRQRELINNSDWTMIINRNWGVELFETKKLALFVKRNWGLVQRRLIEKKEEYFSYAVRLDELYRIEEVCPITTEINSKGIESVLERLLLITTEEKANLALNEERTIIDDAHRICFEPALVIIAKQLLCRN